jgi:hypothetical protein
MKPELTPEQGQKTVDEFDATMEAADAHEAQRTAEMTDLEKAEKEQSLVEQYGIAPRSLAALYLMREMERDASGN